MGKSKQPDSALRAFVEPLMEQRLENLRLLRGLDAVGVVPTEHASLPVALARLLAFDEMAGVIMLTGPGGDPEMLEAAEGFVETGPEVRREVLITLPPALRLRVTGAAAQAVATEEEVMSHVEALRAAERIEDGSEDPAEIEDLSEHVQRMADAIVALAGGPFEPDERIVRQEAKSLPLAPSLDTWLERLPVAWLRGIASRHDLNPRRKKGALVRAVAEQLLSPESLRPVLARRLDTATLICLAALVAVGDIVGEDFVGGFAGGFAEAAQVPWDWILDGDAVMPPGRLRQLGLAFVGCRRGSPCFGMPDELRGPAAAATLPLLREAGDVAPPEIIQALERLASGGAHDTGFEFGEMLPGGFEGASEPAFLESAGPEVILELEVRLRVEQRVTRRILVSSQRSLGSLHEILQIAVGWEGYHLHQFNRPSTGTVYGPPDAELDAQSARENEWETTVGEVLPRKGSRLEYEYDFGDSWQHDIRCVARDAPRATPVEPFCVMVEGACPPEDVGGSFGYEEYLQALADPNHPEHDTMAEWRGPDFNPLRCDLTAVNTRLAALADTPF